MTTTSSTPDAPRSRSQVRRAAFAGFLGSTVEYYDFFIYGAAAALVFPLIFFPEADPTVGVVLSLATFGIGYVARPLGAFVLGQLGDRIGRRKILIFTLLLMGTATVLIGALPSYETIGVAAPILLVLLRLLQGVSASSEQAGASTLTLEHAPDDRRAFYTSFTMSGTQAGQVLASAVFIPVSLLPEEALLSWGWRIPFFIGGSIVLVALWVRSGIHEAEVFTETKAEVATERTTSLPIVELFRHEWRGVLRTIGISLYAVSGTVMGVYALSYGTSVAGMDRPSLLTAAAVANIVQVITIPFWAMLGDRIGRRPVMVVGLVAVIISFYAYFTAIAGLDLTYLILAAVFFGAVGSAKNGVTQALIVEIFHTRFRFTGVAVSTQIAYTLAGFAPAICATLATEGRYGWLPVAVFGTVVMLLSIVATLAGRETSRVTTQDLGSRGAGADQPVAR